MKEILRVENIEKYYGNKNNIVKAVDNVSFKVSEGEFVGIMGASGSGKSTLLNCISTIDKVTSGNIHINSSNITKLRRGKLDRFRREELGFIFQEFNLLDTLIGMENIILPLTINGVNHKEGTTKVEEIAEKLQIGHVLKKYPFEMSGGERQRVAAARAIVNNPSVILADEPTGALDSKSSRMLLECMKNMNEEMRATILMVTHDAFSASYCERILFLKDGKVFNELIKGNMTRAQFYTKIMEVISLLGGDVTNVL